MENMFKNTTSLNTLKFGFLNTSEIEVSTNIFSGSGSPDFGSVTLFCENDDDPTEGTGLDLVFDGVTYDCVDP